MNVNILRGTHIFFAFHVLGCVCVTYFASKMQVKFKYMILIWSVYVFCVLPLTVEKIALYVFVHLNQLKLHMYYQMALKRKKSETVSDIIEKNGRKLLKFLLLNFEKVDPQTHHTLTLSIIVGRSEMAPFILL